MIEQLLSCAHSDSWVHTRERPEDEESRLGLGRLDADADRVYRYCNDCGVGFWTKERSGEEVPGRRHGHKWPRLIEALFDALDRYPADCQALYRRQVRSLRLTPTELADSLVEALRTCVHVDSQAIVLSPADGKVTLVCRQCGARCDGVCKDDVIRVSEVRVPAIVATIRSSPEPLPALPFTAALLS